MELSKCLAVICNITDRDNAQMLAKLSPEEVFDVFERKKYQDANRSEMASFILNSTLRRMKKAYLAVDKSFIF